MHTRMPLAIFVAKSLAVLEATPIQNMHVFANNDGWSWSSAMFPYREEAVPS